MAYTVPDLTYDYAALEPHIDEQTMRIHHDKHHQAYVDNANKALDGTEWADRPVESVLAQLDIVPDDKRNAVRNNVGGHANHSLFWTSLRRTAAARPAAISEPRSTRRSAPSTRSRSSSRPPQWDASAPAGPGWSGTAPGSP